jgi:hypothetical protein
MEPGSSKRFPAIFDKWAVGIVEESLLVAGCAGKPADALLTSPFEEDVGNVAAGESGNFHMTVSRGFGFGKNHC